MTAENITYPGPAGQDLTGRTFGLLTVRRYAGLRSRGNGSADTLWECDCYCGGSRTVPRPLFRVTLTPSCGCVHSKVPTHRRAEYRAWMAMKARCRDPKHSNWHNYGGRGVCVCRLWQFAFGAFLADVGAKPTPGHSIDRRDSNGHYSCGRCAECLANGWPANCRWATRPEQAHNMRTNVVVVAGGESGCLAEWSQRLGLSPDGVGSRLRRGWPPELAAAAPRRRAGPRSPEEIVAQKAAHNALARALAKGRLARSPLCQTEGCGRPSQMAYHHHGYANKLDVLWLCWPCRRRLYSARPPA